MRSENSSTARLCSSTELGTCYNEKPMAAAIAVQIISICMNLVLICMLRVTTSREKRRSYYLILVNTCIADALQSLMLCFVLSCSLHEYFYHKNPVVLMIIFKLVGHIFSCWRIYILMLASIERYYAMCKPYQFSTNWVVNNIGKCNMLALLALSIVFGVEAAVVGDDVCIHYVFGPTNKDQRTNLLLIFAVACPLIVAAIASFKVVKEMMKMSEARTIEDKTLRSATKYVLLNTALFVTSYLLSLAPFSAAISAAGHSSAGWVHIIVVFAWSSYGIGNVILYACMNPAQVKKFVCHFKHNQVSPKDAVASEQPPST